MDNMTSVGGTGAAGSRHMEQAARVRNILQRLESGHVEPQSLSQEEITFLYSFYNLTMERIQELSSRRFPDLAGQGIEFSVADVRQVTHTPLLHGGRTLLQNLVGEISLGNPLRCAGRQVGRSRLGPPRYA